MKFSLWRYIPLGAFMLLACFFWQGLSLSPQDLPLAKLGKPVPLFKLKSLGDEKLEFTNVLLHEQVSLLNVWASWCAACLDEQRFMLKLAEQGVRIYGLNYKDNPIRAKRWLEKWGNPYQLVGEDNDGRLAIDLGVYGAPETFLIDKAGIIRFRYAGALTEKVWQAKFLPLMKSLEGAQ